MKGFILSPQLYIVTWGDPRCPGTSPLWRVQAFMSHQLIHVGLTREWKRRWASPPYREMTEWVEMSPTVAVPGRWVAWWQRKSLIVHACSVLTQCKMGVLAVEMVKLTCWGKSYRKKKKTSPALQFRDKGWADTGGRKCLPLHWWPHCECSTMVLRTWSPDQKLLGWV